MDEQARERQTLLLAAGENASQRVVLVEPVEEVPEADVVDRLADERRRLRLR
jgi:hypothetical protein